MFFVVPGNGQVLLGMPDTVVLNILNLNIDSIQVEVVSCKQTESRKHTQLWRAVQTETQWEPSNKKPTGKMAEISQTSSLITSIHQKTQRQTKGRAMP